jgi:MFS superfamily sulfate permease-like transporter
MTVCIAAKAVNESSTPVRRIVVAAEPVTSIDVTSADMLQELIPILGERELALHFAEMNDPVRAKFKRFEMLDIVGDERFHPTVGSAVDDNVDQH